MNIRPIACIGSSPSAHYAALHLQELRLPVTNEPDRSTGFLLLDVPSFTGNGEFRGRVPIESLLSTIAPDTVICGGNLNCGAFLPFKTFDLLQNEKYLCANAAITADCALQLAMPMLTTTLTETPTLVIGWGRIGKTLSQLLKNIGVPLTVAVRNPNQAAILAALNYNAVMTDGLHSRIHGFRLIINTVPSPILSAKDTEENSSCTFIDLASSRGLEGKNVLWARGLPGIHAPESSGILIAETVYQYRKENTL